jgi:hypothetical protein
MDGESSHIKSAGNRATPAAIVLLRSACRVSGRFLAWGMSAGMSELERSASAFRARCPHLRKQRES